MCGQIFKPQPPSFHRSLFPRPVFGFDCIQAREGANFVLDWLFNEQCFPSLTSASRFGKATCHSSVLLTVLASHFAFPNPNHFPFFSDTIFCSQMNSSLAPGLHSYLFYILPALTYLPSSQRVGEGEKCHII